ncbi:MAG: hypothetical protein L3K17_03365 [Thermoplasmata archaeon]|nr:hypothetical protein [Thermoplasmata archaeon]
MSQAITFSASGAGTGSSTGGSGGGTSSFGGIPFGAWAGIVIIAIASILGVWALRSRGKSA